MTPSALSNETLDELLAAAGKATAGPWEAKTEAEWATGFDFFAGIEGAYCFPVGMDEQDAAYISLCDPQTLTALITELLSYRSEGMTVKDLEWSEKRDENDRTTYWFAPTPWGRFQIDRPDDHLFQNQEQENRFILCSWLGTKRVAYLTLDEAKAAAQLDYATRIKSALIPSTERAETIEACARVAEAVYAEVGGSAVAEKIADAIRALNPRDGGGQ